MKRLITSLIMFLILAFSAAALNIVEDSVALQATHGTTATGSFNVNNTDPVNAINISFSNYVLTYSTYNVSISQLSNITNLAANTSQQVPFEVIVPTGQSAGLYTGVLTATDGSSPDTVQINVTIAQSYSFSLPSEIDLGTISQNSTQTTTFLITNNGNTPLTNVEVSSNAASKYNVTFNQTTVGTLAVNESRTISLNTTIPYTESAGTKTLGNIYVSSTEYNASSFLLKAAVSGRLEIDDLDIKVDDKTDSNVEDGEKIGEKAKSESEIEFKIKIKNKFTDEEDIEIEDIVATITIEEIDDGDDLEEDSSEFDLKAEDSERVTVKFELPLEVEEGDYNVLIHVEGEDDNGVDHEIYWEIELEVEKESHEIKIRKFSASPSTVSCERRTDLSLELINIGKNEEEEVYYLISNSDLGINLREGPFEITDDFDEDENRLDAIHTVYVKDSQAAGTYDIEIRAFYDTDKIDDYQRATLVVNDCAPTSDTTTDTTTDTTDTQTTDTSDTQTTTPTITQPDILPPPETTFKDSNAYLALLGLLILTLGAGVVLAGAYYLSIRKGV